MLGASFWLLLAILHLVPLPLTLSHTMAHHLWGFLLALYVSTFALGDRSIPPEDEWNCTFPNLIDATVDQLQMGLESWCFTSVDLVDVSLWLFPCPCFMVQVSDHSG